MKNQIFVFNLFILISSSILSQEKYKSLMDRYYIKNESKEFYAKIKYDETKIYAHDDYKTTLLKKINKIDSVKIIGIPVQSSLYIPVEYESLKGYILFTNFLEQDSIEKFKTELINTYNKVEKIRPKTDSLKKNQKILEKQEKDLELTKINRTKCKYSENTVDAFDNKKRLRTNFEYIYEKSEILSFFNINLLKVGKQKYIEFLFINMVGCASPYDTDKSTVKFRLTNNKVVTFYHRGNLECGSFKFLGILNDSDIVNLKASPIKAVRITGTEGYTDFGNLDWSTYFIDQLKCID